MKIIIHRGIAQIGGCITEIATVKTRILIDLGQNLPDGDGEIKDILANRKEIEKITQGIDGIFYTHYHGDHLGLFHYVPHTTQQYIGKIAKQVTLCKYRQLSYIKSLRPQTAQQIKVLDEMEELNPAVSILVGDIKVTPYFVSHSAYESYMFLVEAGGRRILHTGDFRGHGYLSKGLLLTIKKLILAQDKIDFLITEGTMLSRIGEKVMSEKMLQREIQKVMIRYKYIFVMCSATDMERLATCYAANKRLKYRPLLCDSFQKEILEIFSKSAGKQSDLFLFDRVCDFNSGNTRLLDHMVKNGFCMFVRATDKFKHYYQVLASRLNPVETVLIYSMWKSYINPNGKHAVKRYIDFISMFPNLERLHTSGHASAKCLASICNLVNPAVGIIPIHSESPRTYMNLPIETHLKEKIILSSRFIDDIEVKVK